MILCLGLHGTTLVLFKTISRGCSAKNTLFNLAAIMWCVQVKYKSAGKIQECG